jgi:hypothetical protein
MSDHRDSGVPVGDNDAGDQQAVHQTGTLSHPFAILIQRNPSPESDRFLRRLAAESVIGEACERSSCAGPTWLLPTAPI